jgi:hypothetical protein
MRCASEQVLRKTETGSGTARANVGGASEMVLPKLVDVEAHERQVQSIDRRSAAMEAAKDQPRSSHRQSCWSSGCHRMQ